MFILLGFAFLAGIATILSPCIIPVLPAILSAGVGKGRYRPLGVILGLVLSFSFFTLTFTYIVSITGLSADWLRYIAMLIIGFFGLVMIFPSLSDWFAAKTSSIAGVGTEIQTKGKEAGTGFWSGFFLGIALGLIWTPCAGPILAAITTLAATKQVGWETVLVTLAYSLGAGIPMFLIAYGGNKALSSSRFLARHSEKIRQTFGVLMILTALAIATNLDVVFQQWVLRYFPSINVEDNSLVKQEIGKLRNGTANPNTIYSIDKSTDNLGELAKVPELVGINTWLNSAPLTMSELRGKVVLIDFWTYSCINCIRTLPYIKKWYDTYKDKGFVVIGVHTPEFEFEKNKNNVAAAVKRLNINYPVALDNDYKTWLAFNNMYWPAHYLVDQNGIIRSVHFGEGGYKETENEIRELLGLAPLKGQDAKETRLPMTPETYLGYDRGDSYASGITLENDENAIYKFSEPLKNDQIGIKGEWNVSSQYIESKGNNSILELNFVGNRVYLVLGGKSDTPVQVELDGKTITSEFTGKDVNTKGEVLINESRMYDLINLHGKEGRHTLTLHFPKDIKAYAFTFGNEM
jgi:cytochrome c biogenesis protein CcdA/thiol-disulfide isomerase/thioredoxin